MLPIAVAALRYDVYFRFVNDVMFADAGQAKAMRMERMLKVAHHGQHRGRSRMSTIALRRRLTLLVSSSKYTVKNIRISMDISWRVFRTLTEPVPYTSVSVNRRNNEARAHIAIRNRFRQNTKNSPHDVSVREADELVRKGRSS